MHVKYASIKLILQEIFRVEDVTPVVKHLPSKHEALS
jgi:hypothetical protein